MALGVEPAGPWGQAEYWGAMEDFQQVMRFRGLLLSPWTSRSCARTWLTGCGHTVHMYAHTQTTHMLTRAVQLLSLQWATLSAEPAWPQPKLRGGWAGLVGWGRGPLTTHPGRTGRASETKEYNPCHPLYRGDTEAQREAETHLDHTSTTRVRGFLALPTHPGLSGFLASAPTPECPSLPAPSPCLPLLLSSPLCSPALQY